MTESATHEVYLTAPDGDRLLKLSEVVERVSLGRTNIYAKMDSGTFPQAVRLGPNCVRWRLSEVNAWMAGLQPARVTAGAS